MTFRKRLLRFSPEFSVLSDGDSGGGAGGAGGTGGDGGAEGKPAGDANPKAGEGKTPAAKLMTQAQIDAIVKNRLEQEQGQSEKRLDELRKQGLLLTEEQAAAFKQQEEERSKLEEEKRKTKGDWEAQKAAMDNGFAAERKAFNDKITELTTFIETLVIDNQLLGVATQNKAIDPAMVAQLLRSQVKLAEDRSAYVADEKGNKRFSADGSPFTIDSFVKEYLDARPYLVTATSSKGGSGYSSTNSQTNNAQSGAGAQGDTGLNNGPENQNVVAQALQKAFEKG